MVELAATAVVAPAVLGTDSVRDYLDPLAELVR